MRMLGFSTGSLALGDFERGLSMLEKFNLPAVELSALRDDELDPLLDALPRLKLDGYQHVSLHAPSRLRNLTEAELCQKLLTLHGRYPIVVHPDIINDWESWANLGEVVLIENMDKRKDTGRTAGELETIFRKLPRAKLCLDVGHSRQIDSSMFETRQILKRHGARLTQVHLSDVTSSCRHEALNRAAIEAFQSIAPLIPNEVPVILETPVLQSAIQREIELANEVFAPPILVTV